MKRDTCCECKYFGELREEWQNEFAYCRFRPPVPAEGWPLVRPTDWCGAWRANEGVVRDKLRAIEEANAIMGDQ